MKLQPFVGTYKALDFKNHCLTSVALNGSEDCLYLNIFRPKVRN